MKKLAILLGLAVFIAFITACQYDIHGVFKENVRWKSDDDALEFEIQGPYNEHYGYGQLKVNNEYVDVLIILSLAPANLTIHTLNINAGEIVNNSDLDIVLGYKVDTINSTTLLLTDVHNNTGDPTYDNVELSIYREDISADELDAKRYLESKLSNTEYGISLQYDRTARFTNSAFGTINYNNESVSVRFIYLNQYEFGVYDVANDAILFSGIYDTEVEYIDLHIDYNDFFSLDVDTIRLVISSFNS